MNERDEILDFPGAQDLMAAGRVEPPSAAVLAAARPAMLSDEGAGAVPDAVVVPLRPKRRRRLLVAAAAVAVLAAGGVAVPAIGFGEGAPPATAAAADFLHRVADNAADGSVSSAPYWKYAVEVDNPDDGLRRSTEYYDRASAVWLAGADGPEKAGDKPKVWPVGDGLMTRAQLNGLPSDPDALRERLGDQAVLQSVDLLSSAPLGPELRGALFDVLAGADGVRLIGPAEDSKGREGTAVEFTLPGGSYEADGTKHELPPRTERVVIDERSGKVLESVGRTDGKQTDRVTVLESGPSDKVG
ncbi:hypothetical protein ACIBI4_22840 [Streptomyces sp. NPDC050418]|uniref:hypothetical protein n=1 Tax=Streptomyces sp. NPDC050418 TaxID=3365612 RepID=UPI0037894099